MSESQRQEKPKSRSWIALVILIAVIGGLLLTWRLLAPATVKGAKTIVVQVVHDDGNTRAFQLHTDQEYLGRALVEGNVVEDNQDMYGLYILTADGETVDASRQEWWCVTQSGESVNAGADQVPIHDGDHFELTFTVGYG